VFVVAEVTVRPAFPIFYLLPRELTEPRSNISSRSASHPLRDDGFDNFGPRLHFECRDIDILDGFSDAPARACGLGQGSDQ
jgi:hypothetical protein